MIKFQIIEFDRDYRTVTGSIVKKFKSKKDADSWCQKESWSGYDYYAKEIK